MAFPNHLLTLATLRLLTLVPANERFHSVRSDPLRVLTELTAAYLHLVAETAKSYAEQAGRVVPNAIDARDAIAHFGVDISEIQDWCEDKQLGKGILRGNNVDGSATGAAAGDAPAADEADALATLQHAGNEEAELGALLKDTLYTTAPAAPTKLIQYTPLTRREEKVVEAVQHNYSLLPFFSADIQRQVIQSGQQSAGKNENNDGDDDDQPSASPSSSRAVSQPPPPSYQQATAAAATGDVSTSLVMSSRRREKLAMRGDGNNDTTAVCRRDDDPLSFLPPFPDKNAGLDDLQTIIEDESGRTVKRARRALDVGMNSNTRKTGSLAWQKAVPYDASSLAEYEGGKFNMPSIPEGVSLALEESFTGQYNDGSSKDKNTLLDYTDDPLAASSLLYFLETFNWVSLEQEQQAEHGQALLPLRHNAKRKRAATAIHSNILNPADDSLSGSIPASQPRHAKKQAGWIPYPPTNTDIQDPSEPAGKAVLPFPAMHPFTTQLPTSLTEPVPTVVLPHPSRALAPLMHPRYPTAHTSIRTLLESSSPALFGRTTRLGPPGPLLDNGSAGYYQVEPEKPNIPGWPGDAMPRMMGWNFDWEIGNELEDAVKQRKASGIADASGGPSGRAGINEKKVDPNSRKGTPGPSTPAGGSYEGPAFPALPARPQYNPLQAQMQREEEEEALKFQEVQEVQEDERQLQEQLRLQQERERAEAQAAAEAAANAAAAARAEAEALAQAQVRAQAHTQAQTQSVTPAVVSQNAEIAHQPKRSLSIKLSAPSRSASPGQTHVAPPTEVEELGDAAGAARSTVNSPPRTAIATSSEQSTQAQGIAPAVADVPISTMWSQSGATLEQDYRAPAADINALVQPPIIIPPASVATEGGIKRLDGTHAVDAAGDLPEVQDAQPAPTQTMEIGKEDVANGQETEHPTPEVQPTQVFDMQAVGLDGQEVEKQLCQEDGQEEHIAGGQVGFDFLPATDPALPADKQDTGEVPQQTPVVPEVPAPLNIDLANSLPELKSPGPISAPVPEEQQAQQSIANEVGEVESSAAAGMDAVAQDGEVDAEQESEDDLFDEVMVEDEPHGESGMEGSRLPQAYVEPPAEPSSFVAQDHAHRDGAGQNNVEIEEMDM